MTKHRLESNSSFGIQYPFVELIISKRTGKMNKLSEIFHAQYYFIIMKSWSPFPKTRIGNETGKCN